MSVYIPPSRKADTSDYSSDHNRKPGEERLGGSRRAVKWSDTDVRHNLYMRLERGDFGMLKSHQVIGIQKIVDAARGADRELEASKVLRVIHDLQASRVELDLDHGALDSIISHLSQGPEA